MTEITLSERDAATGAIVAIKQARLNLGMGNLHAADAALSTAMRLSIHSGAKDVGKIQAARDLPDEVLAELARLRSRVESLEEEKEWQDEYINELEGRLSDSAVEEAMEVTGDGENNYAVTSFEFDN